MLTDINLLPQKEKRSIIFVISLTFLILIGLLGTFFILFQYQHIVQEKERKQLELQTMITLIKEEETKLSADALILDAAQEYDELMTKMEAVPLPTVIILDELTALLPSNGYFINYAYTDDGSIDMMTTFLTLDAAASYLHYLTYEEWIDKVEMTDVTRNESASFIAQFKIKFNENDYKLKKEEVQ